MVGPDRVRDVQRLAVEESRLGIPLLIGFDVIHGHRTLFPVPLGEAAILDPATWAMTARESAREAAADGIAMTFAPMLDVARDPRWGRSVEGPGEDPWLGARFAEAKVRGFQGFDLAGADTLAATAKHFCAYGAVGAGREYAPVDVSERTLHEVYLPPFAAAVASRVAAIMPAFIDLDGVPMTANASLLHGWLRMRQGFDGVVLSDYNAIGGLVQQGVAADLAQAAALALTAGVDIDMMAGAYRRGLPVALERGWVNMRQIDAAVRRVLSLKARLGLFDDPYRRGAARESPATLAARRRLARETAARAIVLLKNEGGVLPLSGSAATLAVLGPLADAAAEMRGPWAAAADAEGDGEVSVVAALRDMLPPSRVRYAAGVAISGDGVDGIAAALDACAGADAILLCLGEAAAMSGEAASRAHLGLPGRQRELAEAVFGRARESHVPVIVILFSGRPLVVPWLVDRAHAVLAAWFPGTEAGNAVGDVLFGTVSPSGRTPVSWPSAMGQIPIYFGQRSTGRAPDPADHYTSRYLDAPNEPLFPFGHGLTYGRFVLSNLRVPQVDVNESDTLIVRVDVRNEGARSAEETVFLFVHHQVSRVVRPLLELKAFGKIRLGAGESGMVSLVVPAMELRVLGPGPDLRPEFETGDVQILVGPCADRRQLLLATIRLTASRTPT
jgi:beta-glucosidase